ncbi:type I-E CRISPR-associated protein Cse1/CasA [Streptomyces sp. NPDC001820]|uniref:type I-E CRISPR-associated protein Cse1/CasA n=1 Tax=Streptomyces sp. NPDC001820 TaxID=3364613 RepID=UPI00367E2992
MPPPTYPIDLRPCIPVCPGQSHRAVGLRELLCSAHRIDDLALPLPPAASALLRVLAAITARVTGLDDPHMPLEQWHQHRTQLLRQGAGFDEAAVHAYFDAHAFDLFHPTRPFLQDASLPAQCERRAGVNALVYGRPAGRNLAWFSPHTDTDPQPVPCDEALWHLLIHHYYGPSGCCSTRTVGGTSSSKGTAGPLRSTVSFHPAGATLFETLLLHLTPYRGDGQEETDACPWEREVPPDPLAAPPVVTWPGRLLTGRSRHAVVLVPTPDGGAVADAYLTWAIEHQHPKLEATDPYLIIDTDPEAPVERRRSPRRADADRAVWRDLDALLLAGDETLTTRRPAVFDTLNDVPEPTRSRMRVRVYGFDQDGKTANRLWYTALTPPIWTWAQEHDAAMAQRIADCRAAAEHLAAVLARAATLAWRQATTPTREAGSDSAPRHGKPPRRTPLWAVDALAVYWPRAETVFWQLVHSQQPPRPVFAREAVAVLRQVTAPALVRHRQAGPALARAVATLRAAGSPTRTRTRNEKGSAYAQP